MAVAMTPTLQTLDWCGSALGLIGAYTLAFRFRGSRYGWLAFFTANIIYIVLASSLGVPGLLLQQIGFVGSSAVGIYLHFFSREGARLDAAREGALHISMELSQLPLEIDAELPPEVARLVHRARRLSADLSSASQACEERHASVAALTRG